MRELKLKLVEIHSNEIFFIERYLYDTLAVGGGLRLLFTMLA